MSDHPGITSVELKANSQSFVFLPVALFSKNHKSIGTICLMIHYWHFVIQNMFEYLQIEVSMYN